MSSQSSSNKFNSRIRSPGGMIRNSVNECCSVHSRRVNPDLRILDRTLRGWICMGWAAARHHSLIILLGIPVLPDPRGARGWGLGHQSSIRNIRSREWIPLSSSANRCSDALDSLVDHQSSSGVGSGGGIPMPERSCRQMGTSQRKSALYFLLHSR